MIPSYGGSVTNVESIRDKITINYSDVRDLHSLPYLVRGQDVIFCLAGQVSHIDSMREPLVDLDINTRSQLSLLECCRRENPAARLVFSSTRQVYGKPRFLPVNETHPTAPTDVNGINKLAAEMYFTLYSQVHGMSTISLRLTNTYGPRMDLCNSQKGFVGVFIQQALAGQTIRLYGNGSQRRDFNYVSDVVDALMLAGQSRSLCGQCFNLGHEENFSLREFVEALAKHCRLHFELAPFPDALRAIDIGDYSADFTAFREATGWRPRVCLHEGLERTVGFFKQQFGLVA
jgi:nucleoside-diphosphate-sugar epimerase